MRGTNEVGTEGGTAMKKVYHPALSKQGDSVHTLRIFKLTERDTDGDGELWANLL